MLYILLGERYPAKLICALDSVLSAVISLFPEFSVKWGILKNTFPKFKKYFTVKLEK